ncbi:hypothetical protein Taro_034906 [Colocasia esculenta]|uniref:CCHC-type domain-containing protein n=1 Tax=Colocasia esculenta TaxID=4460 RepID=A0A843WGX9_COLES|nr:hypothetical protein [Colocasia esculenta]
MECVPEERVLLASYQLQAQALAWWSSEWETTFRSRALRQIPWEEFVASFERAFCPTYVRTERLYQFLDLQQRDSSVVQYRARFVELGRYAPQIMADESLRSQQFVRGLRPELRQALIVARVTDLDAAYQTAAALEADTLRTLGTSARSGSRKKFQRDRRQAEQRQQSVGSVQQPVGQSVQQVQRSFAGQCYRCDQVGHMARDCPLLPRAPQQQSQSQPRVQQQQVPVQQRQQTGGSGGSRGECLLLLLGARAASVVAVFARAVVGFVLGLNVCVGVSRRLSEPACGVAFTSAGLLPVDPVEGCVLVGCVLALCACAPLGTVLYSLVVNSGVVLPEFFSVGSGGGFLSLWDYFCALLKSSSVLPPRFEVSVVWLVVVALLSGLRYAAVVLVGMFWWVSQNGALVVLVEVLPELVVLLSLASVFSLLAMCFGRLFGLCFGDVFPERLLALLVEDLPKAALCGLPIRLRVLGRAGGTSCAPIVGSVMGVRLAMPPVAVLALRRGFLFRVRRRPVVCLLPLLSVGFLVWWCSAMAFGAVLRTVATFVAKRVCDRCGLFCPFRLVASCVWLLAALVLGVAPCARARVVCFVPSGAWVHCVVPRVAPVHSVFEALSLLPPEHFVLACALWLYCYRCGVATFPCLGSPIGVVSFLWLHSCCVSWADHEDDLGVADWFVWLPRNSLRTRFGRGVGGRRVKVGNAMPRPVAFWGPEAKNLGRFPPFSSFSPFSLSSLLRGGKVSLSSFFGIGARWRCRRLGVERRGARRWRSWLREGPFVGLVLLFVWATPGCSIPVVCHPADVAMAVRITTLEEASPCVCPRAGVPLGPSGGNAAVSRAVPCVLALADDPSGGFRKGCRACLCLVATVTWDPQPHASVRGSSPGGGRVQVVEALFRRRAASPSHCLALRSFWSRVGRSGVGLQLGRAAVVVVVLAVTR